MTEEPDTTPKSALRRSNSTTFPKKGVTISEPKDEPRELTPEELENKTDLLLKEFLGSGDLEEAVLCVKELESIEYHPEVINRGVMLALEKKDEDRQRMLTLFSHFQKVGIITPEQFQKG